MKILIIRLSSFGDIILTTPVIEELKKKYPKAKIDFVVLDKFKEAIKGNKHINKLIIFEKERYLGAKGIKEFTKTIKGNNYELVIDLHSKIRSKLISRYLKVKTYRYNKRVWWKSLLVKMKLIKYTVDDTIVKNYFGAVKDLEVFYKGENLSFNFEKKDLERVKEYRDFVVFAPGASKNTKKWTVDNFGRLANLINFNLEKKIILIGGKNEFDELEKIRRVSADVCINLAGKLSLKESGALISKADFVVTNDSGPFHIARGVKTKAFVIFGPTDPKMFSYNENSILLCANESCSPCSLHGDEICPKKHFNCMKNLKADKVFEIIKENIK